MAECPCSEEFFSVGLFSESRFSKRGNSVRLKATDLAKPWASFDRAGQLDIFILGHLLRRWAHFENVGSYFSFQCHERESLSDGAAFEIRLGSGERVFPEIGVGRGQRLRPTRQERRRFGAARPTLANGNDDAAGSSDKGRSDVKRGALTKIKDLVSLILATVHF